MFFAQRARRELGRVERLGQSHPYVHAAFGPRVLAALGKIFGAPSRTCFEARGSGLDHFLRCASRRPDSANRSSTACES